MIKRLDHFGIEVSDLKNAERFYTEVLGMQFHRHLGYQTLLKCGNAILALFENKEVVKNPPESVLQPLGRAHFAFEVEEKHFKGALEKFPALGIPNKGPIDWGDHFCLYFLDPDGNLLEILYFEPPAT